MRILGIDPGTAIMGFGLIESKGGRLSALKYGVWRTAADLPLEERLLSIFQEMEACVDLYRPEEVAAEELFFNRNQTTAISVGEARGVVLLAAARQGLPVYGYTPLQVKQAVVGYGRADKQQIQFMVRAILGLTETPKPDDAADALAVAVCHAHSRRPARQADGG
ncbi:MAG: crossover junction endodeoxyribonuclease RuvC [Gracilibacteraceae bacterium]|jgi:crossover junction endodeoxyribonuclease RuvC|nr:crossover junction endodeoxyribonuclease RuvC [Gracilibacteraceae bacterium]